MPGQSRPSSPWRIGAGRCAPARCGSSLHVTIRAARRTWGGGRPCLPPDRSTCPCRPGRSPRSGRCARPTRWCLPGAACRRRARAGSPSSGRPRAGCRSACGPARPCCARTLPTAAIRLRSMSSPFGAWRLAASAFTAAHAASCTACARAPTRLRAPRRPLPMPSRARRGGRGCTGRRRRPRARTRPSRSAPKSWWPRASFHFSIRVGQA